ncbi:MAG TPA: ABC transporter permease subunit [Anaerolineae bacterium]|nr:ABC transporter permease subunit [Anaerolineae bacterium]
MAEREVTATPFQIGTELPRARQSVFSTRTTTLALLLPALGVTVVFLLLPLAFLIFISLTKGRTFFSATTTFTLENYASIFTQFLPNLQESLLLALLATGVDLIFGFPFAYILIRKVRYRDWVRAFMIFPMFGALYLAFGMYFILLPNGMFAPFIQALNKNGIQIPIYGLQSVVFAMSIFTFPFMVMNIGAALSNVDPKLEEAARCLGAKNWQTFTRVILPLASPGILAGILMCFGWNVGAFAEPLLLGSVAEQRAMALTLYNRGIVLFDYGTSATMGVVLMVIAFSVTYFSLRYSRGALVE